MSSTGDASFRVVKICPNRRIKTSFAWTVNYVATLLGLVTVVIGAIVGYFYLRKIYRKRQSLSQTMYAPIQMGET